MRPAARTGAGTPPRGCQARRRWAPETCLAENAHCHRYACTHTVPVRIPSLLPQTGFIGPAVLLHQLQPTLAANGTAVLLTASPLHRRATLKNLHDTLTSWSSSSLGATQVRAACGLLPAACCSKHSLLRLPLHKRLCNAHPPRAY
jgi:hypothetical protein